MASPDGGPLVGWQAPNEPTRFGIGELGREGWRLARAHLGTYATLAAILIGLIYLVSLPIWLSLMRTLDAMGDFFSTYDPMRYATDPEAFTREYREVLLPSTEMLAASTIASAVMAFVALVALAIMTAAMLQGEHGRPSITGAVRDVLRRPAAIVAPAIIVGAGYALFSVLSVANQTAIARDAQGVGSAGLGLVFSIFALVLEVAAVYYAVRWAVYFQVAITEDQPLGAGLRRASDLTHGIRVRIALTVFVYTFLLGLVIILPSVIIGVVAWTSTGTVTSALVAYLVVAAIGGALAFPWYVGVLTHIYRVRVEALRGGPAPEPESESESEPASPA